MGVASIPSTQSASPNPGGPEGIDSAWLKQLAHDAIGFFEASLDEKNATTLTGEGGGDGTARDAGANHNCVVA